MSRLSLLLAGNAALTQHCGALALAEGHSIPAVVTQDAQVRDWAQAQGLRVVSQTGDWPDELAGVSVDWLLSVANLHMIPPAGLALARHGGVNFHDGPLPRYAGLNAPVWALLNGEARHGISWHLIEAGVDTGDVLEQRLFDIAAGETALTLNSRCFEAAVESFPALLAQLQSGQLRRVPQDMTQRSLYARADRPAALGRIDPSRPAVESVRLVRALDHGSYPNPMTTAKIAVAGRVISVGRAALVEGQGAPGQILRRNAEGLVVACGDGAVLLADLTCSAGLPVDPAAIAAETLDLLSPTEAETLTAWGQMVAQAEPRLRRALAEMQPVDLQGISAVGKPDWRLLPFTAPLPLAALALAALRAAGQARGDLALAARGLPGYVSTWQPLQVQGDGLVGAAMAQVDRALAVDGVGFALDLPQRDRALSTLAVPPVGLSPTGPVAGTVVTLGPTGLHYDAARMTEAAARAYADRLCHIAARAVEVPEKPVQSLPRLADAERDHILNDFNAETVEYDRSLCLHHAFERQVQATPDAVALVCEDASLTYRELDARANRLAQALVGMGAGPGVPVGLCLPRGLDLVAAGLAIWKAGAGYVPMDPSYPADRIALFIEDSACPVIVTDSTTAKTLGPQQAALLCIDAPLPVDDQPPQTIVTSADLAYVIYTSGSTGRPKGVMVEHRQVVNFFAGMDQRLGTQPGTWLALTSLSFDISVLELFWTLTRGYKLVITSESNRAIVADGPVTPQRGMQFSLYYWGNDDAASADKYQLLLDGARFADANGFCAVWTPERHFHAFGGPYPNASVTGAAVAAVTRNIAVRAGSCVAPLHHPIRIAEEWAVVDNLCGGRAGLALASGWHPDDFVLRPENTPPHNRAALFDTAAQLRRLWRGEAVEFPRADGSMMPVVSQPRPISPEVPLWITTAGNPDTWAEAGRIGANLLTHLLGQSIDEVAEKIGIYHQALRAAGHDPHDFTVTLMLHSYLADTREAAREGARGPMKSYLRAAASLIKSYAWAFPAFKKPKGVTKPADIDIESLAPAELEAILDHAFERYFDESGLFGTVEDAMARVDQLKRIGVDEVACLIDYGIAPERVMQGLVPLTEVLRRANQGKGLVETDHSIAAEMLRHGVTHLQCTPSMARMLADSDSARIGLRGLTVLLLGGEALPETLAADLAKATPARMLNMYGPTETTIWSAASDVVAGQPILLGKPLANQQIYVLDSDLSPVPVGAQGEIWIGGAGVTRGYWRQPDLTAERFVADPFASVEGGRIYCTGDLGRWREGGQLEFLGRSDTQIKLRGYRIELGEIEAILAHVPGVAQAVVLVRQDAPGDGRLVAYFTGSTAEPALRQRAEQSLPAHMRPARYVHLVAFPLTPNQKIDRKALPDASPLVVSIAPGASPQTEMERRIAAIWCKVLGVQAVQPEDNFFALGGHSLLAVQVHRDLRTGLGAASLSITDIFRFPTLRAIAAHLAPAPATPVEPRAEADRGDLMARRRAMRAGARDG